MIRTDSIDSSAARVPLVLRAVLAGIVLCGLLFVLVEGRARILRSGTEVKLRTAPVDPRDLFRGDYVILSYDVSSLDLAALKGDRDFARGDAVYVALETDTEGFGRPVSVHRAKPEGGLFITGRAMSQVRCGPAGSASTDCAGRNARLRVAYGLESYFVPQGTGKALERTENRRIAVVAAVDAGGIAAIKRLLLDGKPVFTEPPY